MPPPLLRTAPAYNTTPVFKSALAVSVSLRQRYRLAALRPGHAKMRMLDYLYWVDLRCFKLSARGYCRCCRAASLRVIKLMPIMMSYRSAPRLHIDDIDALMSRAFIITARLPIDLWTAFNADALSLRHAMTLR